MNEELQSANEELETSKEEMQSLNEELSTVNSQLHDKVDEVESASNDMANLLNATHIATVFLDAGLRIKLFTPPATRMFNLIAADIGRPIGDVVTRLSGGDLLREAQEVLHDLARREKEVTSEDGRWYVRRIMPYRTLDDRIDGVVITFVDVTERKEAADAVIRRLAAVVENSVDAIFSKDLDGTIRTWNGGAERLYGYSHDEAVGRSVRMLVPEDRSAEWTRVMAALARGEHVEQLETERIRKDGQRRSVSLTVSPIRDSEGKVLSASVTGRDITDRRMREQELRQSKEQFRQMAEQVRERPYAGLAIEHRGRSDHHNRCQRCHPIGQLRRRGDVRLLRGRNGRPEREDAHAVTQQGRARSLSGEVYRVRRKTRHRHRS